MAKLIQLEEAASLLGMTADELAEMRSRNEIHGYRDGASWKFKMDEIERVAHEKGISLAQGSGLDLAPATSDDDLDDLLGAVDEEGGETSDSVLVSEEELGHSGESTSSTIIGEKKEGGESPDDSDIELAGTGSEVELKEDADDDLSLVAGGSDSLGSGSDLEGGADSGSVGETDTDKLGSDLSLADDDELELAVDSSTNLDADDGDLSLGPSASDMSLTDDDDDDLVLSSGSSDLTLGAGDSGINLSPTDSGLSLEEEPLDLGGSSVEQLELPEDEDVISLDEEATDPDAATQLKADDEFLLTPVEEYADDESSGSQVIALEDSEVYADADAATMLGTDDEEAQPALVAEDADMLGPGIDTTAQGATAQPLVSPAAAPTLPEARYSVWNVLSLMMIMVVMIVTGMFMVDMVRNMVEYDSTTFSTSMIDAVVDAVGLSK